MIYHLGYFDDLIQNGLISNLCKLFQDSWNPESVKRKKKLAKI